MKKKITKIIGILLITTIAFPTLVGCVYAAEVRGRAALAEASYSKQVIEIEAEQQLIAETFRAEAEVVRAKGIAEAMEIINAQLTDEYLKHFWIRTLAEHDGVIYVSIESGFPAFFGGRTTPEAD